MRFFRLTGLARDLQVVASGDPKRITRRAKNKVVAKGLGAIGFWSAWGRLWR